jgi:hypothetical protein
LRSSAAGGAWDLVSKAALTSADSLHIHSDWKQQSSAKGLNSRPELSASVEKLSATVSGDEPLTVARQRRTRFEEVVWLC